MLTKAITKRTYPTKLIWNKDCNQRNEDTCKNFNKLPFSEKKKIIDRQMIDR